MKRRSRSILEHVRGGVEFHTAPFLFPFRVWETWCLPLASGARAIPHKGWSMHTGGRKGRQGGKPGMVHERGGGCTATWLAIETHSAFVLCAGRLQFK